jgi:hypothetical protein
MMIRPKMVLMGFMGFTPLFDTDYGPDCAHAATRHSTTSTLTFPD